MSQQTSKRKKAYYAQSGWKKSKTHFTLRPGLKGFLATCNLRETECVREATNILTEFADKIYGEDKSSENAGPPQNKKIIFKDSDSDEEEEDIEVSLAREVNVLKEERQIHPKKRRFQVIESGATNCVFISSSVESPVAVVLSILEDIEAKAVQRTRFLLRLLPIEITCKAWPDDIKEASSKLLDKYFAGEPKTFCIVFKRRNNSNVLRDELIEDIASYIKLRNPLHRADMKQPELVIIVEVIRNICCMSVVPKYFHYRKYNLLEVAKSKDSACQKESISVSLETPKSQSEVKETLIPSQDLSNVNHEVETTELHDQVSGSKIAPTTGEEEPKIEKLISVEVAEVCPELLPPQIENQDKERCKD